MVEMSETERSRTEGKQEWRKPSIRKAKQNVLSRLNIHPTWTNRPARCFTFMEALTQYVCSLNTHRYAIWRYARKMGGRAFGVTYRLSPQYPWPCALQDCLAAYLYLIRPPPEAKHAPVDPSRIIFAGDSAGGGLVLALLCLIRDMRLPEPACGVLISPWVDLTHSFPSILQNTATDIIMPYGFIHKPSVLWPPPDHEERERMDEAILEVERNETPDDLKEALKKGKKARARQKAKTSSIGSTPVYTSGTTTPIEPLTTQDGGVKKLNQDICQTEQPSRPDSTKQTQNSREAGSKDSQEHLKHSESDKPAKQGQSFAEINEGARAEPGPVVHLEVDGKMVELKEQIQLYATNAQLTHPLVSPMLQPSLGGLPPLLIIAGDKEVLRDEIIYVAHRAANPSKYPLRAELLEQQRDRARLAESYKPTDVHLQVYDGACHVLPMFSHSFTTPAKYCYRSIASFCVSNTTPVNEIPIELAESPGDGHAQLPMQVPSQPASTFRRASTGDAALNSSERHYGERADSPEPAPQDKPDIKIRTQHNGESSGPLQKTRSWGPNRKFTHYFAATGRAGSPASSRNSTFSDPRSKTLRKKDLRRLRETIYTETKPFNRPSYHDHMIRERVGVTGKVRDLEPEADIPALQLKAEDIGLVKEGPVKRYLEGKAIWDKRYAKTYEKIKRERAKHLREAQRDEATRLRHRLRHVSNRKSEREDAKSKLEAGVSELLPPSRGVWDLGDEKPPPSSIAARKDIAEALRLAKVVDHQRESQTHPLALWSEMHDLTWLTRENRKADTDSEKDGALPENVAE